MRFNPNTRLELGRGGNKKVALVARGTQTQKIVFTANTENPAPGYWDCVFFNNGCMDDVSIMEHCVVTFAGSLNNKGIHLLSASPTITNCVIKEIQGDGIYCDNSSPKILQCDISDNSKSGISCTNSSSPIITNCLISDNGSAPDSTGGIYCTGTGASPVITNCTIIRNSNSIASGGGICCIDSSLKITNCILWNNSPDQIWGTNHMVTFSDIQGGYTGAGNINADPLFVDPTNPDPYKRNYHLQKDSNCIDSGTTEGAPPDDKDGKPRDGKPDMGAYEYGDFSPADIWPCFRHDSRHTGRSPFVGAQTGTLKWKTGSGSLSKSSPTIGRDGTVYIGHGDGKIYTLDPNNGYVKCFYTIYVGSYDGYVYALNSDGSLSWRF